MKLDIKKLRKLAEAANDVSAMLDERGTRFKAQFVDPDMVLTLLDELELLRDFVDVVADEDIHYREYIPKPIQEALTKYREWREG